MTSRNKLEIDKRNKLLRRKSSSFIPFIGKNNKQHVKKYMLLFVSIKKRGAHHAKLKIKKRG